MTSHVIIVGGLADPELLRIVAGADVSTVDAGGSTGILAPLNKRMLFYLDVTGHVVDLEPASDKQRVIFTEDVPIDLEREVAEELMRLMDSRSVKEAQAALPQIRMRAATRLRAKANPSPAPFEPKITLDAEGISATRQPYTHYFAVREDDLAFPTFAGGRSEVVTRASFLGGDAVTVLPYDPGLDKVLITRQFRHGPFARGDANPWPLEPAAGRIDPGETPEDAARRELLEETGAEAKALHRIGGYYPSPGAYSEFLYSYVAIADLSGIDGRTGGLAGEAEDIMSHVVSFDHLMALVENGAANTGPLVLSALWLATRRAELRGSD